MVRLLLTRIRLSSFLACFNPTMVRLLLVGGLPDQPYPTCFQSHNGAIAAVQWFVEQTGKVPLSIPQWCDCCVATVTVTTTTITLSIPQWCDCCLRTKLAQAKGSFLSIPQWCDCCRTKISLIVNAAGFQSHNGAIAALSGSSKVLATYSLSIPQWCDCCEQGVSQPLTDWQRFNPTMVRLLQLILRVVTEAECVSIPQWCDCCSYWLFAIRYSLLTFNPTMVRLLRLRVIGTYSAFYKVSIPQWCDCCLADNRNLLGIL